MFFCLAFTSDACFTPLQGEFRMAPDLDMFGQFSSDFVGKISIFVLAPILDDEHSILKSS